MDRNTNKNTNKNTNTALLIEQALELGFSQAAVTKTENLIVVPEYRRFCEENLCGCFGRLAVCPPLCGRVDEMEKAFRKYPQVLVLQTLVTEEDGILWKQQDKGEERHNLKSIQLIDQLGKEGIEEILFMSAGPWKQYCCMSAYCIDAQKLAEQVHMKCWEDDGNFRYFSLICF